MIDLQLTQPVAPRRRARGRGRIGHQYRPRNPFRAQSHFEKCRVEMNAVYDEIRHQTIFGKLVPDVIRMPPQNRMRAVAEMRRERGAR